ncbi:MAG TPA: glycosyltransferase [Kofleriaceae bacterium]|jgi:UDP:flavonoid glycosyltransferase YjiC (YdhE family)|nr:glycosyltransferase [Kofleriaceae bacterium]
MTQSSIAHPRGNLLLVSEAGAGHLNPILGLAEVLRRRGHGIRVAAIPRARPQVSAAGFEFVPLFPAWDSITESERQGKTGPGRLVRRIPGAADVLANSAVQRQFFDYLKRGELEQFLAPLEIDAVLVDADIPSVALAAHASGLPTIVLRTSLSPARRIDAFPLSSDRAPAINPWQRAACAARWAANRAGWGLARRLLIRSGGAHAQLSAAELTRHFGYRSRELDFNTSYFAPILGLPELILCPRGFELPSPCGHRETYSACWLKASFDRASLDGAGFPRELLDDTRPLIYCSLGTRGHRSGGSTEFYRAVLAAMRRFPHWQLVLVAPGLDRSRVGPIPDGTVIVDWAPQLALLKRTHLMITHGGLNSIKECIYAGVPMAVVPLRFDQPGNAMRVAHHRAGVVLELRGITEDAVADGLRTLDGDPTFRTALRGLQAEFVSAEDSALGLSFIEDAVARHLQPH